MIIIIDLLIMAHRLAVTSLPVLTLPATQDTGFADLGCLQLYEVTLIWVLLHAFVP